MRPLLVLASILMFDLSARAIEPWPSGKLELELRKLNTLGSVLYLAAHPDDENTRLIAYLANGAMMRTTYLSLTRGDGGQNLLGTDLGEKLGLIRTQELLAARRIDGGEQLFSRANDFGFSKEPEETLEVWGKDAILADVVRAIRSTRPDVVITRFSLESGITHGHHTASTWLAKEAFAAAGDPKAFPDQLDKLQPWAPTRLLWNTTPWSRRSQSEVSGLLAVDTGGYNPLLGASYAEIAARSRSAHKTQGFGATPELGRLLEHFAPLAGEPATGSLFDGIDTTWARVPDSEPVAAAIQRAIEDFSPTDPAKSVPHLIEAHRALSGLPDQFWRTVKLRDLERVIAGCLGLDVESISASASAVAGGEVTLDLKAIQRSPYDVGIEFEAPGAESPDKSRTLGSNELLTIQQTVRLPEESENSEPYWLAEPHEPGRYTVNDPALIGTPENSPALPVKFRLTVDGYPLSGTIPTTYNYNDPVRGEVKEPFVMTPPAMVNLAESTEIFADSKPRKITAHIVAKADISGGELRFLAKDGWRVEPASIAFDAKAGDELSREATLIPPSETSQSTLQAELVIDGKSHRRGFERIAYEHIPVQTIFPIAEAKLVELDVKIAGERIGYVPGAGDAIPDALRRIGYQVDVLNEADMQPGKLAEYDAIVLGIRALNTNDRIGFFLPALFDYASEGGVLILQYNTSMNLKTESISPLPLTLSRERVTDERAPVRILAPGHPVLNFPNTIADRDFEGWVQERGLYFPSAWDPAFTPIFSMNDPGEAPLDGSLLVAKYGKGWFVSSGLSWFRQLPAGVPGAYRLFANLVSLGHSNEE